MHLMMHNVTGKQEGGNSEPAGGQAWTLSSVPSCRMGSPQTRTAQWAS